MADTFCPVCNRRLFFDHRCSEADLKRIEVRGERRRPKSYTERLEDGFAMLDSDDSIDCPSEYDE